MCVIVSEVPNICSMLRFTQEHACRRISTKPRTPHVYIITVVSRFYFFVKMRIFGDE